MASRMRTTLQRILRNRREPPTETNWLSGWLRIGGDMGVLSWIPTDVKTSSS
jgi:hypothetical protein